MIKFPWIFFVAWTVFTICVGILALSSIALMQVDLVFETLLVFLVLVFLGIDLVFDHIETNKMLEEIFKEGARDFAHEKTSRT